MKRDPAARVSCRLGAGHGRLRVGPVMGMLSVISRLFPRRGERTTLPHHSAPVAAQELPRCICRLLLLCLAMATAGCAQSASPTVSLPPNTVSSLDYVVPLRTDPIFSGLDPNTTIEVLSNSEAKSLARETPAQLRSILWQGMVRNFYLCRSTFQVFKSWKDTEQPEDLPRQPEPGRNLVDPEHDELTATEATVRTLIRRSDRDGLREFLSSPTGCGAWIPLQRSDSGWTIAQATVELESRP